MSSAENIEKINLAKVDGGGLGWGRISPNVSGYTTGDKVPDLLKVIFSLFLQEMYNWALYFQISPIQARYTDNDATFAQ